MTDVTIYHNPKCGTSRKVLGLLEARGFRPRVIEYLKTPPSRQEVEALAKRSGAGLRGLLREKGTPFHELGLGDPAKTDAALLDALDQHPILLNRPIVVTDKGVKLCRPPEAVLELI